MSGRPRPAACTCVVGDPYPCFVCRLEGHAAGAAPPPPAPGPAQGSLALAAERGRALLSALRPPAVVALLGELGPVADALELALEPAAALSVDLAELSDVSKGAIERCGSVAGYALAAFHDLSLEQAAIRDAWVEADRRCGLAVASAAALELRCPRRGPPSAERRALVSVRTAVTLVRWHLRELVAVTCAERGWPEPPAARAAARA